MSSLAELSELVGFFSYSRDDDEAFRGALSALRDGIHRELSAQLGRSKSTFRLWQDQEAIAPGKLWESEIKKAIDESFFFIPIVTPRSVASKYCKFEFESFLAREKEIGRSDLIFPILYISVGALESEAKWRDDPILSIIGRRQYVDWRALRHLDVRATPVQERIERLCEKVVEALNTPWISPEERRRIEEVKARQQAEEEGRRREIEAKRRAEEEHRRQAEAEARRVAEEERRRQKAEAKQRADEEERRKRAEAKLRAEQGQAAAIEPHKVWDWLQNQPSGRVTAGVAALAVLLLIGVGGYAYVQHTAVLGTRQAVEHERQLRNAAEAEVKRINEETEQRRIAAFRADQDRQAAAEAEQKRKADEAEQQRLAAAKAEQERQARAAAEAKRKGDEAESQRLADRKAEQERQAKAAAEAEAKRKEQAEQQRLAAAKAEQERLAKVEQERQASTRFSIIKGLAVKGDEYKFVNTTTIERCSIECAGDTRCKMFAYWENQGISTNSLCYLFDKDFGVYSNPQAQVGYDRSKPFPQSEAKAEESEQQRIANFDSRSLCRVALDVQKSGWDQSTFYAPHVTEASRRGLTVDSCRQLLGMVTLRPGEQSSAQQRGLFTMRTGMEAYGNPTHSFLAESFEQVPE